MRDHLTLGDLTTCVQKLCVAYGKPFGTEKEALVRLWFETLRDRPAALIRAEIDRWIVTESRFPTIAQIRARVWEAMPKRELVPSGDDPLCPGCRQAFYPAPYRVGSLKDNKHHDTGTVIQRLRCGCRQTGFGWIAEERPDRLLGMAPFNPGDAHEG